MAKIVSQDAEGRSLEWVQLRTGERTVRLFKQNAKGAIQVWDAVHNGNTVTFTWGREGGKMQTKTWVCDKGKNIGRANETTPEAQAWSEVQSKAFRQMDKHYRPQRCRGLTLVEYIATPPLPMLACEFKKHKKKVDAAEEIYIQPKLDGCRCVASISSGQLFSRKSKPFSGLDHISEVVRGITTSRTAWLDGELYTHGVGFQKIMSLTRKTKNHDTAEALDAARQVEYHVYDCVVDAPYSDRRQILEEIFEQLAGDSPLKLVRTERVPHTEIKRLHTEFLLEGYEGSIVRYGAKPYELDKRSDSLLKVKDMMDAEYEVVEFNPEKRSSESTLGSVTLVDAGGRKFSARPAMTREECDQLWADREDYRDSGWLATIKFFEMTDDGIPRFPVLKGMRAPDDR